MRPISWQAYNSYTFDDLIAIYDISSKDIFLGVVGNYQGLWDPSLHEYGHAYDFIIGEYFFGQRLSRTQTVLNAIKDEPFSWSFFSSPIEYVANSFDLFYDSSETREELRVNQPMMYNLLEDIERRAHTRFKFMMDE